MGYHDKQRRNPSTKRQKIRRQESRAGTARCPYCGTLILGKGMLRAHVQSCADAEETHDKFAVQTT